MSDKINNVMTWINRVSLGISPSVSRKPKDVMHTTIVNILVNVIVVFMGSRSFRVRSWTDESIMG